MRNTQADVQQRLATDDRPEKPFRRQESSKPMCWAPRAIKEVDVKSRQRPILLLDGFVAHII